MESFLTFILVLWIFGGEVLQEEVGFVHAALCGALLAHFLRLSWMQQASAHALYVDCIPLNAKHCFIFTWRDSSSDKWMGRRHSRRQRWCLHGFIAWNLSEAEFPIPLRRHHHAQNYKRIRPVEHFFFNLLVPYCTQCTQVIFLLLKCNNTVIIVLLIHLWLIWFLKYTVAIWALPGNWINHWIVWISY